VIGPTPIAAARAFQDQLQRALACVAIANQQVFYELPQAEGRSIRPARDSNVSLQHSFLSQLELGHRFLVVDNDQPCRGRWRVVITEYHFSFLTRDSIEVISYHWHPHVPGRPEPHLHLGQASGAVALLREAHLAAGRLSLEEVLLLAIGEFGVEPVHDGWRAALEAGRDAYREERSWA
jgi:hypothetical protein